MSEKMEQGIGADTKIGSEDEMDRHQQKVSPPNLGNFVPVLAALRGTIDAETYTIERKRISIGRVESCDLILDSPNISRVHCFIKYVNCDAPRNEPVCLLVDNQSTNGTYIRGVPINEERLLKHGDTFSIGDYTFGFFIRRETELIIEQRAKEAMTQYARKARRLRVPSTHEVSLNILLPDETFTPKNIRGTSLDVSLTGLRFMTEEISADFFRNILEGNRYMKCELQIADLRTPVELKGRMAWVHFDDSVEPPACIMGIEFKKLEPDMELLLGEELGIFTKKEEDPEG